MEPHLPWGLAVWRSAYLSHLTGENTEVQEGSGSQYPEKEGSPMPHSRDLSAQGAPTVLTGISRERWSAGGCQLPILPRVAALGTGSQPGVSHAASCGPPPPGWTPGLQVKTAPTWQLEPAYVLGPGLGAAPRLSSSVGSHGCGRGGFSRVRFHGGPGWQAARTEAGGQRRADGTGGRWSGSAQ